MIIDCETCIARPRACGDCVVTHLLTVPDVRTRPRDGAQERDDRWATVALDDADVVAVATMAAAGLLPPLRLVSPAPSSTRRTSPPGMENCVTYSDDMPLQAMC